ncbi:MAG: ABC transporter ATP-binding protein/permease [Pseudomonadota bacterium]|nr:ABC transporter ATP-binding protein/permease [Pseudomonadota bacterium]
MKKIDNKSTSNLSIIKNLTPYLWPRENIAYRVRVVLAFLSLILAKVFTVLIPISLIWVVDSFDFSGEDADPYLVFGFGSLGLIIIYNILRILSIGFTQLRDAVFSIVGQNALRLIALRTFNHIHSLSLRFHLTRKTGAISRIVERGVIGTEFILRFLFFNVIPLLFEFFLVMFLLIYRYDFSYTTVVTVSLFFYVIFTFRITEWRVSIREKMNKYDADSNQKAIDGLLNYETVKYFNSQSYEIERYDVSRKKYQDAAVKTNVSLALLNLGQSIIITFGLMGVMIFGMFDVLSGELTLGAFVGLNAIIIQLSMPLNFLGTVYREIRQALVDLGSMFSLLDLPVEIKDKEGAMPLVISDARIEFCNLNFSYNQGRRILNNFSLSLSRGDQIAIVGATGSGKSTIARLLFRFYDPDKGYISIDNQKLTDVKQGSVHQNIGVIPQDTVLFNDTILYNIQYANQDASFEEIASAARDAGIEDFINGLPDGYQTLVGERGLKLSGGEKQRIGIARTILKDSPILLLDEATSSLDYSTEKKVLDNLRRKKRNTAMIIISHRLSAITDVDRIVVLKAGEIVEEGSHNQLLALNGLYRSLWENQAAERQT